MKVLEELVKFTNITPTQNHPDADTVDVSLYKKAHHVVLRCIRAVCGVFENLTVNNM